MSVLSRYFTVEWLRNSVRVVRVFRINSSGDFMGYWMYTHYLWQSFLTLFLIYFPWEYLIPAIVPCKDWLWKTKTLYYSTCLGLESLNIESPLYLALSVSQILLSKAILIEQVLKKPWAFLFEWPLRSNHILSNSSANFILIKASLCLKSDCDWPTIFRPLLNLFRT